MSHLNNNIEQQIANRTHEITLQTKHNTYDFDQVATTYRKVNFCSIPKTDDDSNIPLTLRDKGNRVVLSTTINSTNDEINHHLQHNKSEPTSRTSHTSKNEDDNTHSSHELEPKKSKATSKQKQEHISRNNLNNNKPEHKFDLKKCKRESTYKKYFSSRNHNNDKLVNTYDLQYSQIKLKSKKEFAPGHITVDTIENESKQQQHEHELKNKQDSSVRNHDNNDNKDQKYKVQIRNIDLKIRKKVCRHES